MSDLPRILLSEGQTLRLGNVLRVQVTDIDRVGVRLIAEGQYLGGPEDGGSFSLARELALGSRVEFGPRVALVLLRTEQRRATFVLDAPTHLAPVVGK